MIKLAIDIGSFTTKIFMAGSGIVLTEATCVAVEKAGTEVRYKALGDRARALSGKAARNTHIVNPVSEGDIVHPDLLADLLSYFLEKIEIPRRKARRCEALFILPCGAKEELKKKYVDMAIKCGIGRTCFTQAPFAAVLGHNVNLSETMPVLCLDIGYGITNIAVLSLDGIISGISVNLGGGNIDVEVQDFMAESLRLKVGALTAERIKNTVGSLMEDDNKMMIAEGRNIDGGTPASIEVYSSDIIDIMAVYVDKILEYASLIISKLPGDVSSAVMHGGVYLSGGLAKLDGIADFISARLGLPVNQSDAPALCQIIGGGMIVSNEYIHAALAVDA